VPGFTRLHVTAAMQWWVAIVPLAHNSLVLPEALGRNIIITIIIKADDVC
jgi:hypothetical protein